MTTHQDPVSDTGVTSAEIAALAHLRLAPAEERLFQRQLAGFLQFIAGLHDVDVQGVVPWSPADEMTHNGRPDEVRTGLKREDVLANAPVHDGASFRVPRIV